MEFVVYIMLCIYHLVLIYCETKQVGSVRPISPTNKVQKEGNLISFGDQSNGVYIWAFSFLFKSMIDKKIKSWCLLLIHDCWGTSIVIADTRSIKWGLRLVIFLLFKSMIEKKIMMLVDHPWMLRRIHETIN